MTKFVRHSRSKHITRGFYDAKRSSLHGAQN
ncbi:hypothetical protein BFJ68_g18445 [Fusarium oxysporum]|uniref:Uncharacterized protein n=1 Tax=Fusarium oxysporum TaxID=5507 RepID=A0A420MMX7_FUSOX|nr:hypothetical protein BFJ68_g18445 [Fusarium oxysporum]